MRRCSSVPALSARRCSTAGLSAERPVVILSGNDLEHLQVALGAMWAGIPYAPISPAYSLVSSDYGKLRHAIELLTPGLVFATDGDAFAAAIDAVVSERCGSSDGRQFWQATPHDIVRGSAEHDPRRRSTPRTPRSNPMRSPSFSSPPARRNFRRRSRRHTACCAATSRCCSKRSRNSPPSRRCWSTGCRGTTRSAAATTWASRSITAARSISTTASRSERSSMRNAAQPSRDRADDLLQRAEGLGGTCERARS